MHDCFAFPLEQAPLDPFMQMLSVEYLSLAAEATVVLLLLAFAWPRKKAEPVQASETEPALSWEPAKVQYLQSCVHRGLYLQQWQANHSNAADVSAASELFVPREIEDDPHCPGLPLPWQDRLTRLLNRHGFDAVLAAWLSVDPKCRGESCMAMVTLSKYSDLVSTHGAMVTEQALKRVGTHLAVSSSGKALVARYLPDRFVVLHFASQRTTCHKAMELVLQTISDAAFFKVAGESVALPCNISVVGLDGESDLASTMDALEEGAIESDKSGRRILSRVEGEWTDKPTSIDQNGSDDTEIVTTEQIVPQHGQPLEASVDNVLSIAATAPVDNARDTDVRDEDVRDTDVRDTDQSNDISAVANANDIEALLVQIDTNKSLYQRDVEKTIAANPATVNANATSVAQEVDPNEVDPNEVATADDIASLFSTVKSAIQPLESFSAAVVVPTSSKASLPTEDMLGEIATADDIALLFQNATASAPKTDAATSTSSLLPIGEQLHDPASMEDIAALFDSVKNTGAAATAAVNETNRQ